MGGKTFYSDGPNVELYDALYSGPRSAPIAGDIEFYLKQALGTRGIGGPVLELGCGTGRVSLPLAEAGFDVTGLDVSAGMLAAARRRARKLPPDARVRFVRGDMRRFDLHRRFRLVVVPFRAFQVLLTQEDQKRCLACIRRHLKPGGRLVINLFDPKIEYLVPGGKNPPMRAMVRHPTTGETWELLTLDRTIHLEDQRFTETWEWRRRGASGRPTRPRRYRLAMRWVWRDEMRCLLESSGFRVASLYGDYRGGPARTGAEQVWVVTKPRGGRASRKSRSA